MKYWSLIVALFFFNSAKSQSIEKIMKSFKGKEVSVVLRYCSFPFDLSAGSNVDDSEIRDSVTLKKNGVTFQAKVFR